MRLLAHFFRSLVHLFRSADSKASIRAAYERKNAKFEIAVTGIIAIAVIGIVILSFMLLTTLS